MKPEITHDGYVIVPKIEPWPKTIEIIGSQCGQCGLRVKNGEPTGYVCFTQNCPMGLGPRR